MLEAIDAEVTALEQRREAAMLELSETDAKMAALRDSRARLAELTSEHAEPAASTPPPAPAVPPTARAAATRKTSRARRTDLPSADKLHSWLIDNGPAHLRDIAAAFNLEGNSVTAVRQRMRRDDRLEVKGTRMNARWSVKSGRPKQPQPGHNGRQEPTPMGKVLAACAMSKSVGAIVLATGLPATEVKHLLTEAESAGDVRRHQHNGELAYLAVP